MINQLMKKPVARRSIAIAGLLLFVAGSWISVNQVLNLGASFHIAPVLVVTILLAPIATHLSIRRFQWMGEMAVVSINYPASSRVVVAGGLANILPLPGAFLVRLAYLSERIGIKASARLNVVAALVWMGCALLMAALFLVANSYVVLSFVFLLGVMVATIISFQQLRVAGLKPGGLFRLAALQLVMTMVNILRIVIISYAFDMPLQALVASLMAVTGAAASMTGVFPAGIGLTEILAAFVTKIMSLPASLGFLVSSINRLSSWIALTFFLPIALFSRQRGIDE